MIWWVYDIIKIIANKILQTNILSKFNTMNKKMRNLPSSAGPTLFRKLLAAGKNKVMGMINIFPGLLMTSFDLNYVE